MDGADLVLRPEEVEDLLVLYLVEGADQFKLVCVQVGVDVALDEVN